MSYIENHDDIVVRLEHAASGENCDGHPWSDMVEAAADIRAYRAFVKEWGDRFGFLSTVNDRHSFESIDEVATIIYNYNCNRNLISERP